MCCEISRRAEQKRLSVMRRSWGVNCQFIEQRVFSLLPFVQHFACKDPCHRLKLLGAVT